MERKIYNEETEKFEIEYFGTPRTYDLNRQRSEINSGEVKTEPDMTFTVREILERAQTGLPLNIERQGTFIEPHEYEVYKAMLRREDLTDMDHLKDQIATLEQKIENQKQTAKTQGTNQTSESEAETQQGSDVSEPGVTDSDEQSEN